MAVFNTLTRKFALISIIGLSLIGICMLTAILFLYDIKDEGAAINLAGHLRFRSFKMAWLVQKITQERKPEDAALLKKGLKEEAARFEEILENLQKGNREFHIRPLEKHFMDALLIFEGIVNDWNLKFKPVISDIITLPPRKKFRNMTITSMPM